MSSALATHIQSQEIYNNNNNNNDNDYAKEGKNETCITCLTRNQNQ